MTKQKETKYRPSLSVTSITKIIALAMSEAPNISPEARQVLATLAPFKAKIDAQGITPAYTTTPKADLLTELGGISASTNLPVDTTLDKEDYWEECYVKFCQRPTECSLAEVDAANEYRYLNDIMTEEEEAAFELAKGES